MMKNKKGLTLILTLLLVLSTISGGIPGGSLVFAQENYPGANLVDTLVVSPNDINHTGNFSITVNFSGQSEDPGAEKYIGSGTEIFIPIQGDGVALAALNSQLPTIENAVVSADGSGIRIRFTDGIQNQYDIKGYFKITMSGLNSEEGSTHTLTVGGEHKVNITNNVSGDVGVFGGKTGMMYGESKPGYVTWFLRGNINGDAWPGGPLKIHDKLGEGQKLDDSGVKIGLYWGGQQHQTYSKTYGSIQEFLNDPTFGSAAGSTINYDKTTGEIDIHIPEAVLSEKEFAFTYDALITDHDLEEFTNRGEFDFHEQGKPGRIVDNAVVRNIDMGGGIVGKTRASININKVVKGTSTPIPNVQFEVVREDGGPLFLEKDDAKITLTTDENGQIRAKGFKPGKMVLREIGADDVISFQLPAEITDELEEEIVDMAKKTFKALRCQQFARIDFRLDRNGQPNVIEINTLPGLQKDYSDFPIIAEAGGYSYEALLDKLVTLALEPRNKQ